MSGNVARVLVVDDDRDFAEALGRALGRRGFDSRTAGSVGEALAGARSFGPGCAVVDLRLGEESGLDVIRPLLDYDESIVIVVLTGYGSIASAVEAVKAGAADYLTKPVDVERLVGALRGETRQRPIPEPSDSISLRRLEWEHIQRVLAEHHGNISATARSLGMHRRTLQRKLAKKPVRR